MTLATPDAYRCAERLETRLGDPADAGAPLGYAQTLAHDEAETFPEQACAALMDWGLHHYFVPAEFGGALTSFEDVLALLRVVSRRDLTCAIALGQTYLGAVHVWIGGTPAQRADVARLIAERGQLAFALTEREHGSDVLANEVEARAVPGGYRVSGEKWLINNGTRARALAVFARTASAGPRGYSMFCIDVAGLEPHSYERLAKIHTHGIRGADISGIRLRDAFVPAAARLGPEGTGLELALKGLMITRTMCAAFALGAADTALRLALRFARGRRLYGATVFALPDARRQLVTAFADLLGADVLAIAASRALHIRPEETSVHSAVVKYTVPTLVEELVARTGRVLGARGYVRGMPPWSMHEKLARDVAVVGLFDGNTAVNLNAIVAQLPALMRPKAPDAGRSARIASVFAGSNAAEPFDSARLWLANRGRDDVLDDFPTSVAHLVAMASADGAAYGFAANVAVGLERVSHGLALEVASLTTLAARASAAAFDCARRYCYLHAGATLVHHLVFAGTRVARPPTLALALAQLAGRAGLALDRPPDALYECAADDLLRFEREHLLFSAYPFRIADTGFAPSGLREAVAT